MFVARNQDGSIYGAWTVRQWDGQEQLPGDDAELVAFMSRPFPTMTTAQKLAAIGITADDLKTFLGME